MAVRSFRRGETTYTCRVCKKLTRNTGGDEGQTGLCLDCFNLAGIENGLSDNGDEYLTDGAPEGRGYGIEAREILTRRPELAPLFKPVADVVLNPMF